MTGKSILAGFFTLGNWDKRPPSAPRADMHTLWMQPSQIPFAASAAAYLVKLNENLVSMGDLRQYFVEHPSFIWLCGFPLAPSASVRHGFDAEASLPTPQQC